MELRSLCICEHVGSGFENAVVNSGAEVKSLPMLSVVQSLRGSYVISLDGEEEAETGEMANNSYLTCSMYQHEEK